MNEIENKISNHYGGDGCKTVVDPYGDLLPQCETLKDTYILLKEVGLDTTVLHFQYKKVFDMLLHKSIKKYGHIDGTVPGLGSGKVNNVFPVTSNPWIGSLMGTVSRPRICFPEKVSSHVFVVMFKENDKQILQNTDGDLNIETLRRVGFQLNWGASTVVRLWACDRRTHAVRS